MCWPAVLAYWIPSLLCRPETTRKDHPLMVSAALVALLTRVLDAERAVKGGAGDPRTAIEGTIFEGRVPHDELEALRRTRCVTQALLVEGQNLVRIREPSGDAPPHFEPAAPTLEDAYLLMMRNGEMAGSTDAAASPAMEARP